jgi:protein involved in polysaccharide export with SLBB domain
MKIASLCIILSLMLAGITAGAQTAASGNAAPEPVAPQASTASASAPPAAASQKRLYQLIEGDVIEVRFFFDPELNEQTQIRPDGRVSLQLIGEVEAAGKTVEDLSRILETAYAKELKKPRITVSVRSYAAQKVYVMGEVVRPGIVNMPGKMSVLEALGEAGGIKNTGNRKSVVVVRKGPDGKPYAHKVALRQGGDYSADAGMKLEPYDIVMVPESKVARVDRWVDQYLKQTNPTTMVLGFSYALNNPTSFVPF